VVVGRKMKKHSYFQLTGNRFTGSLMLRMVSIVLQAKALALDVAHYKYTKIHLTKRILDGAGQTGVVMVPTTE
jgi:hypothetical protein